MKEGFFLILDGNLLYRTVIGGKEFVHIVYKDLEVTEKELWLNIQINIQQSNSNNKSFKFFLTLNNNMAKKQWLLQLLTVGGSSEYFDDHKSNSLTNSKADFAYRWPNHINWINYPCHSFRIAFQLLLF